MVKKRSGKATGDASTLAVKKAYDYILDQTIAFGFRPGERINEVELAEVLGLSRAPVREALNRLVVGGFVAFESGKGFSCRKFSLSEISDLFTIREELEVPAVRSACKKATDCQIAELVTNWEIVAATHMSMTSDELILSDEKFHIELASLAGNSERTRVMQNINERIRFVRKINIEKEIHRVTFVDEHKKIAKAILARDQQKVSELMKLHLDLNAKDLKADIHEGLTRIYAEEMM